MFVNEIRRFSDNLNALRDFVDLIKPILEIRTKKTLEQYEKILAFLVLALRETNPDKYDKKLKEIKIPDSIAKQIPQIRKNVRFNIETDNTGTKVFNVQLHRSAETEILETTINEWKRREERDKLLFSNSLISLISAVEWFFSRILNIYFSKYPNIAITDEKVFSFSDLKSFSTVDDARQSLIEKKCENILRGSFCDWIKFFRTTTKLNMSYLNEEMDVLVETCERRNLMVHNSGIVNNIYLSNITPNLTKGIKKGTELKVTKNYLDARISLFEKYCILIASELWKQLDDNDKKRGRFTN